MKRLLALMLALLLACPVLAFAQEDEDEGYEGEIELITGLDEADTDAAAEEAAQIEPFVPDDAEKTILGKDNRVTVKNTRKYPYSAIAYITGKYKCGCNWDSTGFMVNKNTLLTAAHCLVCQKHNKWAKSLTFYFGYRSKKSYLYRYNAKWTAYVATMFPNGYTSVNDWAYVKFEKNVGDKTGWFGMRFLSDKELQTGRYTVAGYRDGKLKYDTGRLTVLDSDRMWLDADVVPGNSGSPIYDSEYYAVGIWTTYYSDANSGFRLTTKVYNKLKADGLF